MELSSTINVGTQSLSHIKLMESSKRWQARAMVLRLLNRLCGALSSASRSRIQELALPQLEQLGEDLLDFAGLADL